jgi:hypothetical protein
VPLWCGSGSPMSRVSAFHRPEPRAPAQQLADSQEVATKPSALSVKAGGTSEAERLVAAVARGVTMAVVPKRAATARMNVAQSADPGEQLG